MGVELCNVCDGEGQIKEEYGGHNRDWDFVKCSHCNGTGRVITREYSYTVPFDADKNIIYKYDAQIIELIRKMESKIKKK